MAIGPKGILNSVKGGAVVTLVVFSAVNIAEYFLSDKIALHTMLGNLTSDLLKVGISATCGALAGLTAGSAAIVGGTAAAPLIVAIVVGMLVGEVLSGIDDKTGATKALIECYKKTGIELESSWDQLISMPQKISSQIHAWERYYINEAIRIQTQGY
ncbi:MAG: hypothetical protein GY799_33195 [Desulfobulbaceae bacterium]|nr:hypothetical protein [Desulfobulbaceae bacterium]